MLIGTFEVHVSLHASLSDCAWKTHAGTVMHANTQRKNQIVFHSGEKVKSYSCLALPLHNTAL